MKKMFALLSVLMLLASACSVSFAESAVDVIMNVGTTQAFSDEAVASEDVQTILQAGMAAASAINQQPWYFVAVSNKEVMDRINSSSAPMGAPAGAPAGAAPAAAPAGMGAKASLGDSPVAIIIYMDENTKSPNASFDCGLAAQNMYIAAASLGYDVKIVSSTTRALNGDNHDALCETLGVDPALQAVAVLLIGHADTTSDASSGATTRSAMEEKVSIID